MRPKNLLVLFLLIFTTPTLMFSQVCTMVETEENDLKVQELGLYIQSTISENNPEGFVEAFDLSYIKSRFELKKTDNTQQKHFQKAFTIGILKSTKSFAEQIITAVEHDAFYNFISYRYDEEAETYYVLFRFFDEENGINYHDYRICSNNGELKSYDLYVYLTGEHLSDTYARVYRLSMLNLESSQDSANSSDLQDFLNLGAAIDYNGKGEIQSAYDATEAIKGDLASEKFVQLIKIRIASQIDLEKYVSAIEAFKISHENDPTIYLTLIDYYLTKEEYDRAYDLIDNLQIETEDDFLYFFKGNLEYLRENYESAENFFTYMMENYVDFFQGYAGYLMTVTQQEKFNEAIVVLDKLLEKEFDRDALISYIEDRDENNFNQFDPLVASEAYKNWKITSSN